ncbi:DUF3078 domain-containing protein [Myroides odoratimimus]|uniref:DUF3078 domain-containing protein n=1 Tax=Myroides odoratimimus TaxID=76832 RepID=UPI002578BE6C|nr:DUF3078 domain-containing protein [Myroides odoratimimus]MDM1395766.1 DUF3078 domain-containing protein [Myroides odoratimimus]
MGKIKSGLLGLVVLTSCLQTYGQEITERSNQLENKSVQDVKKDTLRIDENPYNPLMGVIPYKDYSGGTILYDKNNREEPFLKPAVYVERNKPKVNKIKTNYNPNIDLSLLPINNEIIGYWEKENRFGLDFNQIAFVNWSAGGDNSISGLLKGEFGRKYIKGRLLWENTLNMRYGLNKQSGRESRKTDDVLELNSAFGYKSSAISDWYYVAKLNFKTQFTNGYNYPDTDNPVSAWFAPAYLFVGVGAEYVDPKTEMKYYISPLTYKSTFVLDQTLADQGAFGVTKAEKDDLGNIIRRGSKYKAEIGFLLSSEWKKEIFKNMFYQHKLTLYSDYLNNFGNVNIMFEMKLDLKVNDYVRANVGTYMIYDDNVKNKVMRDGVQVIEGPKMQFKQTLGVGLTYAF